MVLDLRFFDIVFHSHFHFVEVEFFFGRVGVVDLLHIDLLLLMNHHRHERIDLNTTSQPQLQ